MNAKALKALVKAYTYLRRGHRAEDPRPTYIECAMVIATLRGYDDLNAYSMDTFKKETMQLFRDTISMEVATDSNVDEDVRQSMENALFESEQ